MSDAQVASCLVWKRKPGLRDSFTRPRVRGGLNDTVASARVGRCPCVPRGGPSPCFLPGPSSPGSPTEGSGSCPSPLASDL